MNSSEKDIKLIDKVMNATFVNYFSFSKDGILAFSNFNIKNKAHLALLDMALNYVGVFNCKIYLEISFWDTFKLVNKFKFFKIKREINGVKIHRGIPKNKEYDTVIDSDKYIAFMKKSFNINDSFFYNVHDNS